VAALVVTNLMAQWPVASAAEAQPAEPSASRGGGEPAAGEAASPEGDSAATNRTDPDASNPVETNPEVARARARVHFERALARYRNGEYHAAARELQQALVLDPDSRDLVYNLGLVYEKLGDLDAAIAQFLRLLEIERDPAEVDRVLLVLRRLEGARQQREKRPAAEDPSRAPEAPAAEPGGKRPPALPAAPPAAKPHGPSDGVDEWTVGAAALAAVAAVAGASLGIAALSIHPGSNPHTDSATSIDELESRAEVAHALAVAADVSFAVGAAAGATALTLYFSRNPDPERDARVDVRRPLSGLTASLGVGGRF